MSNRKEFSRSDRVKKALIRELSDIISREVKDPRIHNPIISVTDVDLSNDLRHAKVYISVFGQDSEKDIMLEILQQETPRIRSSVGRRIRLRYTPELAFYLDGSLERGSRISELLNDISQGNL